METTLELTAPISGGAILSVPPVTVNYLVLVPNGNPNATTAPEVKQFDSAVKLQEFMLAYTGPLNKLTCFEAYPLSIQLETARG